MKFLLFVLGIIVVATGIDTRGRRKIIDGAQITPDLAARIVGSQLFNSVWPL